jgi:hypothetical protein
MLIGLHGKMRSGKDTAAQFILEWAEGEFPAVRRDAFADRLKISAARALGYEGNNSDCVDFCNELKLDGNWIEVSFVNDDLAETRTISGREYLQYYGTEAHREVFDTDFWVNAVLDKYDPQELLVVTDVRFPNEAEAIRNAGGEVWQVLRQTPGFDNGVSGHASEMPLSSDLIDTTIVNNGTLDHFRDLVLSLMERRIYV